MKFSRGGSDTATKHIASIIAARLEEGGVLWLVSGGSAIAVQKDVMNLLRTSVPEETLEALTILPGDERYGRFGHPDSNATQLNAAGFNPYPATMFDVLGEGLDLTETTEYYDALLTTQFDEANTIIATLGLGADGHTAGILPDSPACKETEATVVGYEWADYTRMTITPRALHDLDTVFVLAYGDVKQEALQRLQLGAEPVEELPSVILRNIPDVTVYNSSIESEE